MPSNTVIIFIFISTIMNIITIDIIINLALPYLSDTFPTLGFECAMILIIISTLTIVMINIIVKIQILFHHHYHHRHHHPDHFKD